MYKLLINIGTVFLIVCILVIMAIPAFRYTDTMHRVLSAREKKENIIWNLNWALVGSGTTLIILGYILRKKK